MLVIPVHSGCVAAPLDVNGDKESIMDQPVHSELDAHDRYQLEFKYDYELLAHKKTRYRIVTYIFLPQSLGINAYTYPPDEFYRSLQNYVRLKTPVFSLQELAEKPGSPLNRAQRILDDPDWLQHPNDGGLLITNFKFLRAILKDALDDCLETLAREADRSPHELADAAHFTGHLSELLMRTSIIVARYRDFAARINVAGVDARVLRSFRLTDESVSLVMEEVLTKAMMLLDKAQLRESRPDLVEQIAARVSAEQYYRRSQQYESVLNVNATDEQFLFRMSVLKKFTSSVLYLSNQVQREGTTLVQILYAIAAGISMIFATFVAFYFQQRYGNFTFPFFLALVIGYMFKDRIKEVMRGRSDSLLRSIVYDRRTIIKTLDGEHELGYLREKVNYVRETDVPLPVLTARNRQLITELDNDGQGEAVIRHEKLVVLKRHAFRHIYADAPEIQAVKDITRIDVRRFLRKMDDPTQVWHYLDGDKVRRERLPRVYYINFVQNYQAQSKAIQLQGHRFRARLTRKGIRGVEWLE